MAKKILIKNGKAFIDEEGKILSSSNIGEIPSGTIDINTNGIYNVKNYEMANVKVPSGNSGIPIEISTNEEMETLLVVENIDKIYKYVGETNETFTNGNLYQVMEVE